MKTNSRKSVEVTFDQFLSDIAEVLQVPKQQVKDIILPTADAEFNVEIIDNPRPLRTERNASPLESR